MRRLIALLGLVFLLLTGCGSQTEYAQIAATTAPVYEFTSRLCDGTDITVARLINESVSCLHDYSLSVFQVKAAESAELIVLSGAGLEDFLSDLLEDRPVLDASHDLALLDSCHHDHEDHHHEQDPHLWLSPESAKGMCRNICAGLAAQYPAYAAVFEENLEYLLKDLDALQAYGDTQLSGLSCRELITFHDGFSYFASAFDLTILEAVEEESGSEASAAELKSLIQLVRQQELPAIFTETNGSSSAASVISKETGAAVYPLDMAMSGDSYFDAMYQNIHTIKEALE